MAHKVKTRIENIELMRKEVENWSERVIFWADWNRKVVRKDPFYEKIYNEVEDIRLKAFNRYLKIINEVKIIPENYKLDLKKIKQST